MACFIVGNTGIVDDYHEAKDACESSLPRDMSCVMIMVPESEFEQDESK